MLKLGVAVEASPSPIEVCHVEVEKMSESDSNESPVQNMSTGEVSYSTGEVAYSTERIEQINEGEYVHMKVILTSLVAKMGRFIPVG